MSNNFIFKIYLNQLIVILIFFNIKLNTLRIGFDIFFTILRDRDIYKLIWL